MDRKEACQDKLQAQPRTPMVIQRLRSMIGSAGSRGGWRLTFSSPAPSGERRIAVNVIKGQGLA